VDLPLFYQRGFFAPTAQTERGVKRARAGLQGLGRRTKAAPRVNREYSTCFLATSIGVNTDKRYKIRGLDLSFISKPSGRGMEWHGILGFGSGGNLFFPWHRLNR